MPNEVVDKDKGWKRFLTAALSLRDGSYAKVGVLSDTEEGGLHEEGGRLTVGEIAAVQEYGTEDGTIPARPFVRATFDESVDKLRAMSRGLIDQILFKGMTTHKALNVMGSWLAAAIKKRVTGGEFIPPPLKQATIAAKGSDRPLVDTGRMIGAVTHVVVDKAGQAAEKPGGGEGHG